jgi:RimJ/RimL family protein N-acetyltransferase
MAATAATAADRRGPVVTVLETERLQLRRVEPADADDVARWSADPDFTRLLEGPRTREQSDAALARWIAHWETHGFGIMIVEWRATGEPIGRVGVQFHPVWSADPEIGWGLAPAWWGRGLATEAGGAAIAWAFGELGLARVVSITSEANLASRRVMAKLGFQRHAVVESEWGELWVHLLERDSVDPGLPR